ncbi:Protein CBG12375 [Caenorhabditis briggsae]|uniref:Protein CBG12375 n=1 Tax=Caenorhabditis briggsae TaxID=6238 RepID=A8XFA2_CAEBR|nr:Protein CBG12375 [Caenorhabditis briggsae]CAP31363.2 Protein CBG12375 [Caenorhabditis briggsae]
MSLSLLTPRLVTKCTVARILVVRNASSKMTLDHEQSIKISDQQGFFKYQRDVSRDARYSNPIHVPQTRTRLRNLPTFRTSCYLVCSLRLHCLLLLRKD